MPTISGILETALYVKDLERSLRFYRDLFAFDVLAGDERFRALSVADKQVLLLFRQHGTMKPIPTPGGSIPPHDGQGETHFALSIPASELSAWESLLHEKGIAIESRVRWERGGVSLYFRDPDNHLVELATPGIWAIF